MTGTTTTRRSARTGPTVGLLGVTVAVLAVLAAAVAAPAGCIPTALQPGASTPASPAAQASLSDVALSPERYYGRAVTVNGLVDAMIGPNAFVLRGEAPLEVGAVLVVSRQPLIPVSPAGGTYVVEPRDLVRITGTVRPFDLPSFERELRLDLPGDVDAFLVPWENKPAIVVESVRAVESLEFAPAAPVLSLDTLMQDPRAHIGHAVTVEGQFDREVAPHAFLLEDRDALFDDELLVITTLAFESIPGWPSPAGAALDRPTTPITVRGVLRHLEIDEVERELGIDLDRTRLLPHAGRPVILSTRLAVTPGESLLRGGPDAPERAAD